MAAIIPHHLGLGGFLREVVDALATSVVFRGHARLGSDLHSDHGGGSLIRRLQICLAKMGLLLGDEGEFMVVDPVAL